MSSTITVIAIICILAILICGAFIAQATQQRREKHYRLLTALRAKSRRFRGILNTCPNEFLSRDLMVLVLRTIIDTSEKLAQLEKSNSTHLQDVSVFTAQLKKAQQKDLHPAVNTPINPMEVNNAKSALKELEHYIHDLEEKQALPAKQTTAFKDQIKYLMFKLAIDSHELQAQTALEGNKPKIASHHYETAVDMITKNAKNSVLAAKLPILEKRIAELKQRISEEETHEIEEDHQTQVKDSNQEFLDNNEDSWKKKTVYDS